MDTNNNKALLFSVLIANYNNGVYLDEAIDSIKAQTYKNWEIIIVDDCSTDNSADIYKKYETDPHIQIYYNDKNHGCGYTKRRCAELAHGDICGFLDPDDTLTPDALEVMVEAHRTDEKISLVYSRHNVCDAKMNFIRISHQQREYPEGGSFLKGDGGVSAFASFKTALYRKTSGINPEFIRAIDHDLYFKMEEQGRFLFIDKVLYNYRTNTGQNISICGNGDKAYLWHLVAAIDACRRRGLSIEDVVLNDFQGRLGLIVDKTENRIKCSRTYLLGNAMLAPFKYIRKILK